MPVCIGCGGSYEDKLMVCPYCGRAHPELPKVEIDVRVSEEAGKSTCPSCHRADKTRKVSGIIASQTHATGTETPQGLMVGSQISLLVHKLSLAPQKPQPVLDIGLFTFLGNLSFLLGIAGLGLSISARNWELRFYLGLLAVIVFGVLGFVFRANVKKKKLQAEILITQLKQWEMAMERYNGLFYCAGCDTVYLPGKGDFAPVKDLTAYVCSG